MRRKWKLAIKYKMFASGLRDTWISHFFKIISCLSYVYFVESPGAMGTQKYYISLRYYKSLELAYLIYNYYSKNVDNTLIYWHFSLPKIG